MTKPADPHESVPERQRALDRPARFDEALRHVRGAIAACERAGVPHESLLTAMMAELMPRLSACYGPRGVSAILSQVATAMDDIASAQRTRQ